MSMTLTQLITDLGYNPADFSEEIRSLGDNTRTEKFGDEETSHPYWESREIYSIEIQEEKKNFWITFDRLTQADGEVYRETWGTGQYLEDGRWVVWYCSL